MSKTKPTKTHCLRGHSITQETAHWNGRSWSCLLCGRIYRKASHERLRKNYPLEYLLRELKKNAKKRGSEFSITKEDLLPLPTHCPVFGVFLEYTGNGGPNAASFDRTDCSKGYVAGNVVIMSKRANLLKNNATANELQLVVDYLRSAQPSDKKRQPRGGRRTP